MEFDSLLLRVMAYGKDLMRCKKSAEMEKIRLKYIKMTLGLDRCTTGYIVMTETSREKFDLKQGEES